MHCAVTFLSAKSQDTELWKVSWSHTLSIDFQKYEMTSNEMLSMRQACEGSLPTMRYSFFLFLLINILSMKLIENILHDHVDNHLMDDNYFRNDHWLDLGARASEPDKELPCFSPSFQSQTRSWEWWLWCFCEDEHEDTSGMDGDCVDNYQALKKSSPAYLTWVGTAHKTR